MYLQTLPVIPLPISKVYQPQGTLMALVFRASPPVGANAASKWLQGPDLASEEAGPASSPPGTDHHPA
jgi:hypothetical protein